MCKEEKKLIMTSFYLNSLEFNVVKQKRESV